MKDQRVIYISYNGATEPVSQSQVIPYLKALSRTGYSFDLVTFEKKRHSLFDYVLIKKFESSPKFSDIFMFLSVYDYLQLEKIKLSSGTDKVTVGYDIYIFQKKGKG